MASAKMVQPRVRVWMATLAEADLTLRDRLDERELKRFLRYDADADRARFLLGAAMLRTAVGQASGTSPLDVPVDRTCGTCGGWHGMPVVPGSPFSLSVSHGGAVVVLAMSDRTRVGVDVERVGRMGVKRTREWTRAEAEFKAGGGAGLQVHQLAPPVPEHIVTLVTDPGTWLEMLSASELLSVTPAD